MDAQQFLDFYRGLVEEEISIFTLKGGEYSGEINRFANFERLADELGLHPLNIAWIYAAKHKDSVVTYIQEKTVKSNEDIIGRISDFRNYLALLGGMVMKYRALPKDHKWYLESFNDKTQHRL